MIEYKYKFRYYKTPETREQETNIVANSDEEAVKKFIDKQGILEYGCIRSDGKLFTDEDHKEIERLMKNGC